MIKLFENLKEDEKIEKNTFFMKPRFVKFLKPKVFGQKIALWISVQS